MLDIPFAVTGQSLPLEALSPYPGNPKRHPEDQIRHIEASILRFGFLDPIGVWGKGHTVVEGHGRLMALKNLTEAGKIRLPEDGVPVLRLDHLTREERDAYMAAHNQQCMETDWDTEALSALLSGIETVDLESLGLDLDLPLPEEAEEEVGDRGIVLAVDCRDEAECEVTQARLLEMGIPCRRMKG